MNTFAFGFPVLGEHRVAEQTRESNGPERQGSRDNGPTGPPTKRGQLVTV